MLFIYLTLNQIVFFTVWLSIGLIAFITTHYSKLMRWNFYNWHFAQGKDKEMRDNPTARRIIYSFMFITFLIFAPLFFFRVFYNKIMNA